MAGKHFKDGGGAGSAEATGRLELPRDAAGRAGGAGDPSRTGHFQTIGDKVDYFDFGQVSDINERLGRTKAPRRAWPFVVAGAAVLAVALGLGGLTLLRSAQTVESDAHEAKALLVEFARKGISGDEGIQDDAERIGELAREMRDETEGPLWTVAAALPVYGGDVSAARELSDILADVSDGALTGIAQTLAEHPLKQLARDGGIDVDGAQAIIDGLAAAAPALTQANEDARAIGPVATEKASDLVETARTALAAADRAANAAAQASPILRRLLGAEGARSYLVVAENNAEIRALGGFSGASGVMTVENGQLSLGEFEPAQTMADHGGPTDQITISDEEWALFQPYGETLDYTAGDSFFVPDMTRGSELTRTLWAIRHDGQQVDGVLALDPTFLQYLLQVAGSVTASDGTVVDGENAVQVLLSDVYWKYPMDGDAQDAVFSSVAKAAFDKIVGDLGSLDMAKLAKAVERGAGERRVLAWMADADEEGLMETLGIDGNLPSDPARPETGVFVNNYSFSKLDYYLDLDVTRGGARRNADGTATYDMAVTLINTLDPAQVGTLPPYFHDQNGEEGQEVLGFYLYAPAGGSIQDVSTTYGELAPAAHMGLSVMHGEMRLKAGETVTVTYTVTVPAEGAGTDLRVHVTPTAQQAREGNASLDDDAQGQVTLE